MFSDTSDRRLPVAKGILVTLTILINVLALNHTPSFDVFFTGLLVAFLLEDLFETRGPVALVIAGFAFWNATQSLYRPLERLWAVVFVTIGLIAVVIGSRQLMRDRIDEQRANDAAYVDVVVVRRVFNALRDRPRSVGELSRELDHTESRIEFAVEFLEERNFVSRDGDIVRLRENADGVFDYARITAVTTYNSLFDRHSSQPR